MLGTLSSDIEGKLLVLMLDEATKLTDVTNPDAVAHWRNAFKLLSGHDAKEVGFIISATFLYPDDMPKMLADQQIRTRFGPEHYILLSNFGAEESKEFLVCLLKALIDDAKRDAIVGAHSAQAEGETVDSDSFPFTSVALDEFVAYACRSGGYTTPRDLQSTLDAVLNRAIDENRHILSSGYMLQISHS
jgi:hypothetical protein